MTMINNFVYLPLTVFYSSWSNARETNNWNKDFSPRVNESKTVVDSGFQAGNSGFQVLDCSLCQWNLDSGFQKPRIPFPHSLRSRRLEVVGERENSPLACLLFPRRFFLVPTISKRLLRNLFPQGKFSWIPESGVPSRGKTNTVKPRYNGHWRSHRKCPF